MDIIRISIKCFHCKKTLESPVLLPCGESICRHHINEQDKEFFCVSCTSNHPIPSGGFYPMKALENIIKTQIERIDLGVPHNDAYKSCKKLETILGDIDLLKKDPFYFINESINEIRNDVEIKREELKLKIDLEANRIVQELNAYEQTCKTHLENSDFVNRSSELETNVKEIKDKLSQWLDEFKTIDSNEEKWKCMKENSDKIIFDLESKVIALKQDLLLDKLKEYQLKPIEFSEIDINSTK